MIFFSWKRFCSERGIPYVERGPNTARNHISIRCPFCGNADKSEHMGLCLDPRDPKWGCFRSASHRGRDPAYLVQALLGCPPAAARDIVNAQRPETDAFEETVQRLLYPPEKYIDGKIQGKWVKEKRVTKMPTEFKPLDSATSSYAERFLKYLEWRGFDDAEGVASQYDLHYCLSGRFRDRLIIPFFDAGELVGWTGRTLDDRRLPRYLTTGAEDGATVDADSFVWERSWVARGSGLLVVVEGPLDVLKLDWYAGESGLPFRGVVTCLFGKPKRAQAEFLFDAARRYDRVLVALDADAYSDAVRFAAEVQEMSGVPCSVPRLPTSDPGAMTGKQVRAFLKEVAAT